MFTPPSLRIFIPLVGYVPFNKTTISISQPIISLVQISHGSCVQIHSSSHSRSPHARSKHFTESHPFCMHGPAPFNLCPGKNILLFSQTAYFRTKSRVFVLGIKTHRNYVVIFDNNTAKVPSLPHQLSIFIP